MKYVVNAINYKTVDIDLLVRAKSYIQKPINEKETKNYMAL